MSKPTVLLFDIDGTLVTTGGAGRRAIVRAFEEAFGRADAFDHFSFAGMTDRAIVRAGLEAIGRESSEAAIDAAVDGYLTVLEQEIAAADGYRLHTGMLAALDAAAARERVAIGLGTGNVERGAYLKLRRAGVEDRFAFGGYGSDHEDRAELIRIGAERGAAQLRTPVAECRVVVIGDTPKDIAAALANGADSIGVGTGGFTPAALLECGATAAFADLAASGALEELLR